MVERVSFTTADGVRWAVYPVPARRVEHNDEVVEDAPAHLCVEAAIGERVLQRRLDDFPADWPALPPADLVRLSALDGAIEGARLDEETDATRRAIAALET